MDLTPATFGSWVSTNCCRQLVDNQGQTAPSPSFSPLTLTVPQPGYMLARAARTTSRRCASRIASTISSSASFTTSASRRKKVDKSEDRINYIDNEKFSFSDIPDSEHAHYKRVTANDLEQERYPPRRAKMLVRDFIEDSLYNPNYGYFSKQVNIFTAPDPVDLSTVRNTAEFEAEVAKRYASYGEDGDGPGKQLWHTPTELLKVSRASNCPKW